MLPTSEMGGLLLFYFMESPEERPCLGLIFPLGIFVGG